MFFGPCSQRSSTSWWRRTWTCAACWFRASDATEPSESRGALRLGTGETHEARRWPSPSEGVLDVFFWFLLVSCFFVGSFLLLFSAPGLVGVPSFYGLAQDLKTEPSRRLFKESEFKHQPKRSARHPRFSTIRCGFVCFFCHKFGVEFVYVEVVSMREKLPV